MISESHERSHQSLSRPHFRHETRPADVASLPLEPSLRDGVQALLTPKEVLAKGIFAKPEIIYPPYLPNFASLLARRDEIRGLELLPAKSEEEYVRYHGFTRQELVGRIETLLGQDELVLAENEFPYFLPSDVQQNILWMNTPDLDETLIVDFLGKIIKRQGLTPDEVILFERPLATDAKMVRGTLPEYRHIHVWTQAINE